MLKNKNIFGFTLVELIVVITIVGILSTVGFVSYSGYLAGARDSNRFSQLTKLSDSLQVYAATKSLPLPDDYIEVSASGTVIAYQGYVGVDVLETIDYTNGGKDPKDDSYYTYYLAKDRNSMQLLAMMEEQSSVTLKIGIYAADYTERVPKVYGKKLGVLTELGSNTPIQEVSGLTVLDIVSTTDLYISHISDNIKLEGTGSTLQASILNGNCKRIKQMGKSKGNGNYIINPAAIGDKSVYCDMETSGGGWTMVGRSATGSTGVMGWGSSYGNITNNSSHYSLGSTTMSMNFSEIMVGRYSRDKDIDYAVKFTVDDDNLNISTSTTFVTSGCKMVVSSGLTVTEKAWIHHCKMFQYWGDGAETTELCFSDTNTCVRGLGVDTLDTYQYNSGYGAFHGRQGMVFIR